MSGANDLRRSLAELSEAAATAQRLANDLSPQNATGRRRTTKQAVAEISRVACEVGIAFQEHIRDLEDSK